MKLPSDSTVVTDPSTCGCNSNGSTVSDHQPQIVNRLPSNITVVDLDDFDADCFLHEAAVQRYIDGNLTDDESTLPGEAPDDYFDDNGSESSSLDLDNPVASLSTVNLPEFVKVARTLHKTPEPPATIRALYEFTKMVENGNGSVEEMYEIIADEEELLSPILPPRAHTDGGALATTCNQLRYLWCYRQFTYIKRKRAPRLKVADDTIHVPTGIGYIRIPCETDPGFVFVRCYYTPEIPATILSPHDLARIYECKGYTTYSDIANNRATMSLVDCARCNSSIDFNLTLI